MVNAIRLASRLAFRLASLVIALVLAALCARAQTSPQWPQRPVRLMVPFGAGSATDLTARLFAERLSNRWAQPVVVENRPGADSILAVNAFVANHDDHTLLYSASAYSGEASPRT